MSAVTVTWGRASLQMRKALTHVHDVDILCEIFMCLLRATFMLDITRNPIKTFSSVGYVELLTSVCCDPLCMIRMSILVHIMINKASFVKNTETRIKVCAMYGTDSVRQLTK